MLLVSHTLPHSLSLLLVLLPQHIPRFIRYSMDAAKTRADDDDSHRRRDDNGSDDEVGGGGFAQLNVNVNEMVMEPSVRADGEEDELLSFEMAF